MRRAVLGTILTALVAAGCDDSRATYGDLKPIKAQLKQIEQKVDRCVRRAG